MIPEIRNHSYHQRIHDLELFSDVRRRLRGQPIEQFKYLNGFTTASARGLFDYDLNDRTRNNGEKYLKTFQNIIAQHLCGSGIRAERPIVYSICLFGIFQMSWPNFGELALLQTSWLWSWPTIFSMIMTINDLWVPWLPLSRWLNKQLKCQNYYHKQLLTFRLSMRLVMPFKITGRDLNEHEWECDWVFWGSSSLLSFPHLFICRIGGAVVVVGSCVVLIVVPKLLLHTILSSPFSVCCEWTLHEKPQASILL